MKNVLAIGLALICAATLTAQDITMILSERPVDLCQPHQILQNVFSPVRALNLFGAQAWALHHRHQVFESADNDLALGYPQNEPNYGYMLAAKALVLTGDTVENWDLNKTRHAKFAWLFEQNRSTGGQFGLIVAGEAYSEGVVFDDNTGSSYPQGTQGHSFLAGRGCNATMSDVIGDCGAGPNKPCIEGKQTQQSRGHLTVALYWTPPSAQAILYSSDSEDTQAYGFDWTSRADALQDMIRGYVVYYRDAAIPYTEGDATGWTVISDGDYFSVDRGDGLHYSTDTRATVNVPGKHSRQYVFAIAPVFDGQASQWMPGDGGYDPLRAVTLAKVVSGSSVATP